MKSATIIWSLVQSLYHKFAGEVSVQWRSVARCVQIEFGACIWFFQTSGSGFIKDKAPNSIWLCWDIVNHGVIPTPDCWPGPCWSCWWIQDDRVALKTTMNKPTTTENGIQELGKWTSAGTSVPQRDLLDTARSTSYSKGPWGRTSIAADDESTLWHRPSGRWLVYLPLWKIWLRQLGWWHSRLNGNK